MSRLRGPGPSSETASMCFNNGAPAAANPQTQLLEQQQAKHDADVAAGKKSIDDAFGQFDQGYFDAFGKSYNDAYQPQLTDQYGIAKDKVTALLAGTDQLGGSVGNDTEAQLYKTYANNQSDIANKAADATNTFRANVDASKSNLYQMNAQAADPASMATQAQATAGTIVAPASYPTLGNVFADALGSVATATKANSTSMNPWFGGAKTASTPTSTWFANIGQGQG